MTKNDQKCWSPPGFEPGSLQREKKSENFLSKALPLSHGGITLDSDKGTKEFPMEQNVATKYRTCIDISL